MLGNPHRDGTLFLAAVLAWALGPLASWGQFDISPSILEIRSYPSSLAQFDLVARNSGTEPMDCLLAVSGMEVALGGLPSPVEDAARNCAPWIEFPQGLSFQLEPGSVKRILGRLRPPRDAAGGYYAIVSCAAVARRGPLDSAPRAGVQAGVDFRYRTMIPVLLTVISGEMRARVEAAPPLFEAPSAGQGYTLLLPVRNTGNIHTKLTGDVEIRSEAGQVLRRFNLDVGGGYVLPNHERIFPGKEPMLLPNGVYRAIVHLASGETQQPMQRSFSFYVENGKPSSAEISEALREKLAQSAPGFSISPRESLIEARPGGRTMRSVEALNLTREPIRLKASLAEWIRGENGIDAVLDGPAAHGRSALPFLQLPDDEFEIRPLGKLRLPVIVAPPAQTRGERYAAICFEQIGLDMDSSPEARANRSALLRIDARGNAPGEARIENLTQKKLDSGAIAFSCDILNTGETGFIPEFVLALQSAAGASVGRLDPPRNSLFYIQAGRKARIELKWDRILEQGEYSAGATLRFDPSRFRKHIFYDTGA